MVSWRASYVDNDDSAGIASVPATAGKYVGAAFQQQKATGAGLSNTDDRVDLEASITAPSTDTFADGLGNDYGTGTLNNAHITYGEKQDVWYDTLRPNGGFPLPIEPDTQYVARTDDGIGDTVNETIGYLATVGERALPDRRSLDIPSRESTMPSEQQKVRPWDILLGAWPWLGEKVSLQRPLATTPMTFDTAIPDALPTPTGTSGADIPNTPNFSPYALTFRTPPEPWDTSNGGNYVDSGT